MKRNTREILFFASCIILVILWYLILRLPNLTLQPIFADEAIYIRWAQIMRAEPTLRFLPLSDGKTPLFMWMLMPMFKIFPDPLFAGRFLSVMAGLGTVFAGIFLGWKFFNIRVGLLTALFLAVTPFIVFFDRMALVDSMLSAFTLWSLAVALLLLEYPRIDLAILLGYLLGGGVLTKTPGFLNVFWLPVTIIKLTSRPKRQIWLKIIGLWGVAVFIMLSLYGILKLGPGFSNLSARNQDYIFSPLLILHRPWDPLIPHLRDLADWLPKLLTPTILLLISVGVLMTIIKPNKIKLVILLWSILPLLVQLMLLKTFTARYILPSIPPLLCLAAIALESFLKKTSSVFWKWLVVILLVSLLPIRMDYQLITDPQKANLPKEERRGYFEDWTAGFGFKEIADYLGNESRKGEVIVGTEGYFGTLPDGLAIYLDKNRKVVIVGGGSTVSAGLRQLANQKNTFYVANKSRFKLESNLELVKEFPKAVGSDNTLDSIVFYKVLPRHN